MNMNFYDWLFVVVGALCAFGGLKSGRAAANAGNWTGMIWHGFFMIVGCFVIVSYWK